MAAPTGENLGKGQVLNELNTTKAPKAPGTKHGKKGRHSRKAGRHAAVKYPWQPGSGY